jgi:DNA-binding transcriptional ArsR family regulator
MDTEPTADSVFGLLADEIRLDILRTVARAQHENRITGVTNLSFSDIYDRVDVDGTSKLSYHLGELTGTFLRKHENGYAFTHAGEQMVHRGSRLVRRAFAVPLGWKHFEIARDDIRQNNQRAQQARDKMGELPQEILERTLRSRIAPEIHKVSSTTT